MKLTINQTVILEREINKIIESAIKDGFPIIDQYYNLSRFRLLLVKGTWSLKNPKLHNLREYISRYKHLSELFLNYYFGKWYIIKDIVIENQKLSDEFVINKIIKNKLYNIYHKINLQYTSSKFKLIYGKYFV